MCCVQCSWHGWLAVPLHHKGAPLHVLMLLAFHQYSWAGSGGWHCLSACLCTVLLSMRIAAGVVQQRWCMEWVLGVCECVGMPLEQIVPEGMPGSGSMALRATRPRWQIACPRHHYMCLYWLRGAQAPASALCLVVCPFLFTGWMRVCAAACLLMCGVVGAACSDCASLLDIASQQVLL